MNILVVNVILISLYAIIFLFFLKKKKLFIFFTTLNLIIINGLRDSSIGIDTIRYERNFYNAAAETMLDLANRRSEFGYNLLTKVAVETFGNFNLWLLIVAIFMFVTFGWFVYKYSKNAYISFLVFLALGFYGHTFNITRQLMAVMIVLLSYPFLLNRKLFKFSGTVFIASLFHSSALVFLLAYIIDAIKIKRIHLYWLIPLILVFYKYRLFIANYIMTVSRPGYLGHYVVSGSTGGITFGIIVLLVVNFIFNSPFKNPNRENVVLTKLVIVALFIQILSSYAYAFTRANLYFLIYLTLYIPQVITGLSEALVAKSMKDNNFILSIINLTVIVFLMVYYNIIINIDGPGILPYRFFWKT